MGKIFYLLGLGYSNFYLRLFIIVIDILIDDAYSNFGLILLFVVNLIAFIVDVILIDYYGAI